LPELFEVINASTCELSLLQWNYTIMFFLYFNKKNSYLSNYFNHIKTVGNGVKVQTSKPARIFHESPAATKDMVVLPGVLGCRFLRRTFQVRLETNTLRLPGGPPASP